MFRSLMLIGMLAMLLGSCGSVKHHQIIQFEQVADQLTLIDSHPVLKIADDDILDITVSSRNVENVAAFAQAAELRGDAGERAFGLQRGYRVDEQGMINLPFIGPVKASEKTIIELRHEITDKLSAYVPDASVQIRYLNFRVTLLGEVTRPNTYTIPNERLTLLEALGMAGDFTSYAKRDSVLVIRERGGQREFVRLNTQKDSLFASPYFYLKPNDIIYVEPLKAKKFATQGDFVQRYAPVLYPLVALLTAIITVNVNN